MGYDQYKKIGLTQERYTQMIKIFSEKYIDEVISEWGVELVNKGYSIFNYDGTGMLQIEEIDVVYAFNGNDDKAARQAAQDGIKIIPIKELPINFDRKYFGWIDTPENRMAIQEYCNINKDKTKINNVQDVLIQKIKFHDETIEFYQHGINDFSICFDIADYSVRGTLEDILNEYHHFKLNNFESEIM